VRIPDVIDVLVVDDHELFTEALSVLLQGRSDVRLLGAARAAEEALAACQADPPDVVLMDVDLPGEDGIEATRRIRASCPDTKVVVVTGLDDPAVVASAIAAGACGYVPKTRAPEEILDVVRRAAAGELVMPETHLAAVLAELEAGRGAQPSAAVLRRLTAREGEILRALAAGDGVAEIAAHLGISVLTVRSHVKNILAKLGVHSSLEAVTLAWRAGFASATEPSKARSIGGGIPQRCRAGSVGL
jgi:DNA-binding NarL/FixJ family response regulator